MNELKWTTDKPTTIGWYWLKENVWPVSEFPQVVYIGYIGKGSVTTSTPYDSTPVLAFHRESSSSRSSWIGVDDVKNSVWAGPLEPPTT